jgi:hypothetical protein
VGGKRYLSEGHMGRGFGHIVIEGIPTRRVNLLS